MTYVQVSRAAPSFLGRYLIKVHESLKVMIASCANFFVIDEVNHSIGVIVIPVGEMTIGVVEGEAPISNTFGACIGRHVITIGGCFLCVREFKLFPGSEDFPIPGLKFFDF